MLRNRLLVLMATFAVGWARAEEIDFDSAIAPLLASSCLDCHQGADAKGGLDLSRRSSALAGGESGVVLEPGNLEGSLLWDRVVADEMPPKHPLTAGEKELLKRWIEAGTPWGTDPIDPFRITTGKRAGYDWWSLQPVRRPDLPDVKRPDLLRNPIDHFVLGKLEQENLTLAPEADRRTLIRRVYFDLVGLPPSSEEVEAFVRDDDPNAYEKVVDRLLASPHYGERWARHWLDIVRFGETDGFERNGRRPNAWPYRNWVIEALNADMPYDQFCRWQLAGDLLEPTNGQAIAATGYLVAGVHNTVLGNDMMRAIARQDELEDVVGNIAQTFLGLTANCARCHDHKFDPIAQQDFYRLASSVSGVVHGERSLPRLKLLAEIARTGKELKQLRSELVALDEPFRRRALQEQHPSADLDAISPSPIASWDLQSSLSDKVAGNSLAVMGKVTVDAEGAHLENGGYLRSEPIAKDLEEKTLEVWLTLEGGEQGGGGAISLETLDGQTFDAIVFAEQEPGRWMAGSNNFARTNAFHGPVEETAQPGPVCMAIVYAKDGTITGYRNGERYGKAYKSSGPQRFAAGKSVILFGCRHEPAGGNRMLRGTIQKGSLYDRALSPEEIEASARLGGAFVSEVEIVGQLTPEQRARRAELTRAIEALQAEQEHLIEQSKEKIYAAVPSEPGVTRLLRRGDVTLPDVEVTPGGISAVGGSFDFGLPADAEEGARRKALAEWVTQPDNPLFARVIVNRLWHYHFGTGLVETPSDFGFNGGRPSHPELLDWLATELVASGFRLKHMHRLLVTSASYRQSSAPLAEALQKDADSRLLWRKKPMRMEGEVLRDSMLAVSELLNREVGGEGFSDYKIIDAQNGTTYYEPFDPTDVASQRRSIYRFLPRGGNQGLLDAFDCPDSASSAPRRNQTTTPLQALELWNGAFVFRIADHLATDIQKEAPKDVDRQIDMTYQRTLQRLPTPAERAAARQLVERYPLRALCRAIFNTNEFLTVD